MLKKILVLLLSLFSFLIIISCNYGDLTLTIQFENIDNLISGDRVFYHNEHIGNVEKIFRNEKGNYQAELNIDSDYKKELTVYSIFYIDYDPGRPNQKAVLTEQSKPGGNLLNDNSVIVGQDSLPYLQHMMDDFNRKAEDLASELAEKIGLAKESYKEKSTGLIRQLEEALAEIDQKLRELEKTVRTTPESETAKELKRNLDRLIYNLENTLGEVATAIGQDLYERLHKSLDNLKNRLDELNRHNQPPSQHAVQKDYNDIKI